MDKQILSALSSGFSSKQIIDYLIKKFPQHEEKIKTALAFGFNPANIIKKITNAKGKTAKQIDERARAEALTEHQKTRQSERQQLQNINQGAAAIGGAVVAGPALGAGARYALGRALPKATQALQGLSQAPTLQQTGQQVASQLPAAIVPTSPQIPQSQQASPQPQQPQFKMPPSSQPPQPRQITAGNIFWDKLEKGDLKSSNPKDKIFLKVADSIRKQGGLQTPEEFERFTQDYQANKEQYDSAPKLARFLKDKFNQTYGQKAQQPQQASPVPGSSIMPNVSSEQRQEKITPLKQSMQTETQGNLALTPQGDIGEIESIKNGVARIKVGDQIKTRKEADLQTIPISQPDLADLYENLIKAIPEKARSSVINFAGYDADANELIFRPHGGAAYVFKDIPQEFADKLKDSMFKAKTTGENFYGAWESGEGSRFAGLAEMIGQLQKQYGGKGKEYIRKYATLVDILGEPEKAKKEKHKAMMAKKKDEKKRKKPIG